MLPQLKLTKPTKSSLLIGTLTNTKLIVRKLKLSSMISAKPMMSSPIEIVDLTTMMSAIELTPMRMLIRPSNDSLKSMEWKTKMKRNSLINITLTEEEITMRFLVFLRMLPWMRLKKLIGDFLCSIIQRITLTMLMLEKNSMKSTKPIMPCPQKLKDTTMTLSPLAKLPLSELTTSLKISGETDSVNGMTLMISSDQHLEPDGAVISTEC